MQTFDNVIKKERDFGYLAPLYYISSSYGALKLYGACEQVRLHTTMLTTYNVAYKTL